MKNQNNASKANEVKAFSRTVYSAFSLSGEWIADGETDTKAWINAMTAMGEMMPFGDMDIRSCDEYLDPVTKTWVKLPEFA